MTDWQALLDQARAGAPRDQFYDLLPELCSPATLRDDTRLRLLGNAVANDNRSRKALRESGIGPDLVRLPGVLTLQILLNAVVDSTEMAQWVADLPGLAEAVAAYRDGTEGIDLIQELYEQLGTIPEQLGYHLLDRGFVQLILVDPAYETSPHVLDHFRDLYDFLTRTHLPNPLGPPETTGVRIVGAVSSNPQFTLERSGRQLKNVPFSWELITVLANLTARLADVPEVLELWPDAVSQTLQALQDSDFGFLGVHVGVPFLRNVSRVKAAAQKMSQFPMAQIVAHIVKVPLMSETVWHLAAHFMSYVYSPELIRLVSEQDPSAMVVFLAAKATNGLVATPLHHTLRQDAQSLALAIEQSLIAESSVPVWISGTHALVVLTDTFGAHVHWADLSESAPDRPEVVENITLGTKMSEAEGKVAQLEN